MGHETLENWNLPAGAMFQSTVNSQFTLSEMWHIQLIVIQSAESAPH